MKFKIGKEISALFLVTSVLFGAKAAGATSITWLIIASPAITYFTLLGILTYVLMSHPNGRVLFADWLYNQHD